MTNKSLNALFLRLAAIATRLVTGFKLSPKRVFDCKERSQLIRFRGKKLQVKMTMSEDGYRHQGWAQVGWGVELLHACSSGMCNDETVPRIRCYNEGLKELGLKEEEIEKFQRFFEQHFDAPTILQMMYLAPTSLEELRRSCFQLHGVDPAGALVPLFTPTYNRLYMQHLADPKNCPDPAKTPVTPQEICNKLVPGIIEWLKDQSKSPPAVPDYFTCCYMSDPKLGM